MFGSNKSALAPRLAGVRHATESGNERGAPQKLTGMLKGEVLFLEYNNTKGVRENVLVFKVGDQYMTTPDSPAWCKALRPISSWLQKQVETAKDREKPVTIPDEDSVSVVD